MSAMNPPTNSTDYINTTDYKRLEWKMTQVKSILDDLVDKSVVSRKLRFAEIDIEIEREAGRIGPNELYIPTHIIDTNIRREQSSYIQYVTQSPRAVILRDPTDATVDLANLERDLTDKLRYDGWQLSLFSAIDAFQANGYSVMEVVQDQSKIGEIAHEHVSMADFAYVADTRDLQACEMLGRTYHYTRTKLLSLCGDAKNPKEGVDWVRSEVDKVIEGETQASVTEREESSEDKDKSLFRVQKIMFRVNGVVHVGWACIGVCDDWLRIPKPLYIGRRRSLTPQETQELQMQSQQTGQSVNPQVVQNGKPQFETNYPYFLFQYLISEDDTISHLKGRIFLDQDAQEGVSSLMSATLTQARNSAGPYWSKTENDPNDDVLMRKNIFFKPNCLMPSGVQMFKMDAPEPGMFQAINLLVGSNQSETSQVNFAENNNQKDSRKTAAAVNESRAQRQELTTVQVVLFSQSLRNLYTTMSSVIKSRVLTGLLQVNPTVAPLYQRTFQVKPSGDVDVIEKNNLINAMMQAWGVIQNTGAAIPFLCDMLEKSFPDNAAKYIQAIQQQQQQAQSQQAQQMNQMKAFAIQLAQGMEELDKHKNWFSEEGQLAAYPLVQRAAIQIDQMREQMKSQQPPTSHHK